VVAVLFRISANSDTSVYGCAILVVKELESDWDSLQPMEIVSRLCEVQELLTEVSSLAESES
jgi:hypothetical protein